MINLTRALFVVVVPFLFFSCKEEVAQTDCPPTIGCTEVFVSVTLEVVDTDGEPVALDDYNTFIDSKNEFKIDKADSNPAEGIYPVASDAQMNLLSFEGTVLTFVGVIDDQNVVEHQMTIGKDCCHIQLLEGEEKIVVDL
jgi:hypothetical protein